MNIDVLLFILFILVIAILIYKDRKKVKLQGIVLIRRTKKGRNFIDRVAKKYPKFWNALFTTGIVVVVPAMFIFSLLLVVHSFDLISGQTEIGGTRFLLPGPTQTAVFVPGALIIPWWIWVVAIAFLMIPHEFSHGITCRLHNIRIKSVGWLLLLVLPGAFVEQDDRQLNKAKTSVKLKVYAAGSFANIIAASIILLILMLSSNSLFQPAGMVVIPQNNTPAYDVNLTGSIYEMDGVQVRSPDDIKSILGRHSPDDVVEIKTVGNIHAGRGLIIVTKFGFEKFAEPILIVNPDTVRTYYVELSEHPDERGKAYLGIAIPSEISAVSYSFIFGAGYLFLYDLLFWLFLISLMVGLVNLLPIKPLDGGLIFEEIVGKFTKNKKPIVKYMSLFMILILAFNILWSFIFS